MFQVAPWVKETVRAVATVLVRAYARREGPQLRVDPKFASLREGNQDPCTRCGVQVSKLNSQHDARKIRINFKRILLSKIHDRAG